jgi:hypothetical protein
VVTVAVEPGRGKDRGQAVEELESREAEGGPAGWVGLGQEVENLVRAAADQVEPFEGEGWPGTVTDQPLQSFAVCGLDTDTGVQAEPAAVIPRQHVFGFVGLQEAVAAEVAEDSYSDRVLETLQELVGESRGFVETETGFRMHRIQSRVTLNLLEESIHDAQVEMVVRVQRRAEAMEKADGAHGGGPWGGGRGFPQGRLKGPEQDVKDGAGGAGPVMKEGPEALGDGEHELAHRHVGKDVVHQVGCGLGHTLGPARGAGPPAFAGERDPVALHLSCTAYNVGFD